MLERAISASTVEFEYGRVRESTLYRFTVRCDRKMNERIKMAAARAGMSDTAFVQAHFDTILDPPAKSGDERPDDFAMARTYGVTITTMKLYRCMLGKMSRDGYLAIAQRDLADAAEVGRASIYNMLRSLEKAGLVALVKRHGQKTPATYRVNRVERAG